MNYERLHDYYGCMSFGKINEPGNPKPKTYSGTIGHESLRVITEHPGVYEIRPILKPIESLPENMELFGKIAAAAKKAENMIDTIKAMSIIINILRSEGYDTDGLIDRGQAVLHSDYDATKLF